jgi:hypothetical protein
MTDSAKKGKSLALILFCLGLTTGALGSYVYETRAHGAVITSAATNRQLNAAKEKTRLYDYLDLTPEQRENVDRILDETRAQYQALAAQTRPEATALGQRNRDRIRAVLTENQRLKYDEWRDRRQTRR